MALVLWTILGIVWVLQVIALARPIPPDPGEGESDSSAPESAPSNQVVKKPELKSAPARNAARPAGRPHLVRRTAA